MKLSKEDAASCQELLSEAEMFQKVPPHLLSSLVGRMDLRTVAKNEIFIEQDDPTDRFFLLEKGTISRKHIDPVDGRPHKVEFAIKANSINSMRVLSGEPAFSSVKCVSDSCKLYQMKRSDFLEQLAEKPEIATHIAEGLCDQLRSGSKKYQTPLLQQRNEQDINFSAVSIAAGIESYYRSALNAILNARLTGVKSEYFPMMHVQVPTRIAYIAGFKGLRSFLDQRVDAEKFDNPTLIRLLTTISPGIIMTPISSLLEASNAGHMNKEPLSARWMRGIIPRGGREIIFGVGLNQLSDFFEERIYPYVNRNHMMANAGGSLAAGVVSGYLSHVPHNMSTFKLLEPHRSYGDLYKMFVDRSVPPVIEQMVESWPSHAKDVARTTFATLFPRGLMVRTTQIVGSFMILNGTINFLQLREKQKIQQAMGA